MSGPAIIVDIEDRIAIVTLSRPEKHNAFNQPMRIELADAVEKLTSTPEVQAIVITGHGKHFSVGGDIAAFAEPVAAELDAILNAAHRCIRTIRHADKPVIAAVEGAAMTGLSACRIEIGKAHV